MDPARLNDLARSVEEAHALTCHNCRVAPTRIEELSLELVRPLYQSSHLDYFLHRCRTCGRTFLMEGKETIDWGGRWGTDLLWTHYIPLTDQEADELRQAFPGGEMPDMGLYALGDLMQRRGKLAWDPDGRFYWTWSLSIGDILPPG